MTRWILLGLLTAVGAAGCGPVGQPSLASPVPVTGKVTLASGKPLGNVVIHFQPLEAPAPASGKVSADGSFASLTTYEKKEGICKGKYAVYFRQFPGTEASKTNSAWKGLPERMRDETSGVSPIQVEITSSGQILDIQVDPAAK